MGGVYMMKAYTVKKIVLSILLTFLLICQTFTALAAEPAPGESILKIDRSDVFQMPKDFRTSKDDFRVQPKDGILPSREGLDTLNISGSSIFSQLEFSRMLTKLPANQLIIVDLRLESHGYLNGTCVSWYGTYNGANLGKSATEVKRLERQLLDQTMVKSVQVAKLAKDKSIASTIEMNVAKAMNEEELVTSSGVKYYRIQCPDYVKPTDENVDQFLSFYKMLPKDAWLHFHCHAGEGRTTVFMAMYDMLRNAQYVSYEDIMKRQYLLGGQDIRTATSSNPWKKTVYAERAKFTEDFYEYVKQSPDNLPVTWSEWARNHSY